MSTESPLASDPESFTGTESLKDQDPANALAPFSEDEPFTDEDGVLYDEEVTPEYGVLGFTLRELLIVGVWLIIFVTSFFPLYRDAGAASLWTQGIHWILPLGLPTVAVFLIVLRRFSPDGIRRVGSLGIDQFASVAFSVSALYWAMANWDLIALSAATGTSALSWLAIVQFIATLALVALTVFAPLIPGLREDFRGRLVTLAHRNANPVRPVIARPRTEKPAPASQRAPHDIDSEVSDEHASDEIKHLGLGDSVPMTSHASSGDLGTEPGLGTDIGLGTTIGAEDSDYAPAYARSSRGQVDTDDQDAGSADAGEEFGAAARPEFPAHSEDDDRTDVIEDLDATAPREAVVSEIPTAESAETAFVDAAPTDATPAVATQPFWALAPTEREVFDERGEPLFRVGPSAWALVVEDRGGAYVVRHDDGRIGYLHDISDITKG